VWNAAEWRTDGASRHGSQFGAGTAVHLGLCVVWLVRVVYLGTRS
jgi:hypothetical protein